MVLGMGNACTLFQIVGRRVIRKMSHFEPKYLWITREYPSIYGLLLSKVTRWGGYGRLMSQPFGSLNKNEIPFGIKARKAPNLTPCELSRNLGESGGTTGKWPEMVLG